MVYCSGNVVVYIDINDCGESRPIIALTATMVLSVVVEVAIINRRIEFPQYTLKFPLIPPLFLHRHAYRFVCIGGIIVASNSRTCFLVLCGHALPLIRERFSWQSPHGAPSSPATSRCRATWSALMQFQGRSDAISSIAIMNTLPFIMPIIALLLRKKATILWNVLRQ